AARPWGRTARRWGRARPSTSRAARPSRPRRPAGSTAPPAGARACRPGRAGTGRRGPARRPRRPTRSAPRRSLPPPLAGAAARRVPRELRHLHLGVPVVRVDDFGDQLVPHDVAAVEPAEVDVVDAFEDLLDDPQPALLPVR